MLLAVGAATILVDSVTVITGFVSFKYAVAAVGALTGAAVPSGVGFLCAVEATAIARQRIAVITRFWVFRRAIAAFHAG